MPVDKTHREILDHAINIAYQNATKFTARQPNSDFATTSAEIDSSRGKAHLSIGVTRTQQGLDTEVSLQPAGSGKGNDWSYRLVSQTVWPDIYGQLVGTMDHYPETQGMTASEALEVLQKTSPIEISFPRREQHSSEEISFFLLRGDGRSVIDDLARMVRPRR
ncbi:MAG: hypothetical protein WAV41_01115 [Microgenomates group bacterium]